MREYQLAKQHMAQSQQFAENKRLLELDGEPVKAKVGRRLRMMGKVSMIRGIPTPMIKLKHTPSQ